jgi:hypothetical protein
MGNIVKENINNLDGIKRECYEYFNREIFAKGPKTDYYIAGGSLRRFFNKEELKTDIDLYFPSHNLYNVFYSFIGNCELINKNFNIYRNTINSLCIDNGKDNIDIIRKVFLPPEKLLEEFDFSVCCCALTKDSLYYHSDYFEHLANKQIVINNKDKDLDINRVEKYILKGYSISEEQKNIVLDKLLSGKITKKENNLSSPKISSYKIDNKYYTGSLDWAVTASANYTWTT